MPASFSATKNCFANEIGRAPRNSKLTHRPSWALLCRDTRLNLSPLLFKAGQSFWRSCLPKDVRALTHHGRQHGLKLPMPGKPAGQQRAPLDKALLTLMTQKQPNRNCHPGPSFKPIPRLARSAMVEACPDYLGRGYRVRIYDPALNLALLVGSK